MKILCSNGHAGAIISAVSDRESEMLHRKCFVLSLGIEHSLCPPLYLHNMCSTGLHKESFCCAEAAAGAHLKTLKGF